MFEATMKKEKAVRACKKRVSLKRVFLRRECYRKDREKRCGAAKQYSGAAPLSGGTVLKRRLFHSEGVSSPNIPFQCMRGGDA